MCGMYSTLWCIRLVRTGRRCVGVLVLGCGVEGSRGKADDAGASRFGGLDAKSVGGDDAKVLGAYRR